MARNQKKADIAAKHYKDLEKRIAELKAKRTELQERNKTENSILIFGECMTISEKITSYEMDLNNYAHLVVKYLYGDEEE